MERAFLLFLLLAATASCFAQSGSTLYDADGYDIGTVVNMDGDSDDITVRTADGYLLTLDLRWGGVSQSAPLYFANAECSGKAYIPFESTANWSQTGGAIFADTHNPTVHARLERVPIKLDTEDIYTDFKCWRSDYCGGPAENCFRFSVFDWLPVIVINNRQYGLRDIGFGAWGYLPPLIPVAEELQLTDCDGFGNCPVE